MNTHTNVHSYRRRRRAIGSSVSTMFVSIMFVSTMSVSTMFVFIMLCIVWSLTGCGTLWGGMFPSDGSGVKISQVRSIQPKLQKIPVVINRETFRNSFATSTPRFARARPPIDEIRIIEVFERDTSVMGGIPRYRLFSIVEGGPYDTLGLRDSDVLIAADDWVIFQPLKFKQYVTLLQEADTARIEILRNGNPTLLDIQFFDH